MTNNHPMDMAWMAESFLRSAAASNGNISLDQFHEWFDGQCQNQRQKVEKIAFSSLDQWYFTTSLNKLAHRSGKFFTIEGVHVETDFGPVPSWSQPIIRQPEVGILGMITRETGGVRHFLMQAKIEPGIVNDVQLAPTVQATRSNYTCVHQGAHQNFLEYFTRSGRARILVDQLQGEQGSRFFRKQNRNMIVEIDHDIDFDDRFCWLTLGQIKSLLQEDNLVNMDSRSVIACIPFIDPYRLNGEPECPTACMDKYGLSRELCMSLSDSHSPVHQTGEIIHWLTYLRSRYQMKVDFRPLDRLNKWHMDDHAIYHDSNLHFSVIAVEVESGNREVVRWTQPLLAHSGYGLNGFLVQRRNDALHFLVRASMYPGNRELFELGSTVSRSNMDEHMDKPDAPLYSEYFRDPLPPERTLYEAIQSEEGGRFYNYQNRYVILELPPEERVQESETHRWMTLRQIHSLINHGYFNIEARNLLACLDFTGEK